MKLFSINLQRIIVPKAPVSESPKQIMKTEKNQIQESKLKKTTSTMKTLIIFTQKLLWCTMLMNSVWEMRGNCDVTGVFDSSAIHTDNTSLSAKGIGLNRYQRPAHSKQVAFVHTPIDLLSGGRVFCCFFFPVNTWLSVLMSKVNL